MPDKKKYGWTGNAYQRLYLQPAGADSVQLFPLDAGTDYHIGPASFTEDGKEMYFAVTRLPRNAVFVKGTATINIEIYYSVKDSLDKWSAPVPFRYNNVNAYSVGDPFISPDGRYLYFASNMPGGAGGTDLYRSSKGADGWEAPVNLKEINTEGNERSPFLDTDNTFYFSSDGRVGMGGLDIFRAACSKEGEMGQPVNLGYPFNSPQDDFAYRTTTDSTGYFSSNRMDGAGGDDIYSFHKQQINTILQLQLSGIVYNKKTNVPLANAIVSLRGRDGNVLKVETGSNGAYQFPIAPGSVYDLTGEKTNFNSDRATINTEGLRSSTALRRDLYLDVVEIDKAIRLENIYYDFDRWEIRPDAAVVLDTLVRLLKDNPTIWIELGSHTDSRGNDAYNMVLSQKRAEAAVNYIISRGIAPNRIEAKGYGETQLLNECANGVPCSPAAHQLNRRTEFKIVKQ
jgi:outer membrane protein OmpA-like peptidoglycan-associated protein